MNGVRHQGKAVHHALGEATIAKRRLVHLIDDLLAEDIGQTLGVGAYCRELRRTKVGDYAIEQAASLNDLGITS